MQGNVQLYDGVRERIHHATNFSDCGPTASVYERGKISRFHSNVHTLQRCPCTRHADKISQSNFFFQVHFQNAQKITSLSIRPNLHHPDYSQFGVCRKSISCAPRAFRLPTVQIFLGPKAASGNSADHQTLATPQKLTCSSSPTFQRRFLRLA